MSSGAVLIVPACERGRGGGHLGRSLFLFQALRERGRDACLWIPEHCADDVKHRFNEFFESFDKTWGLNTKGQSRLLSHNGDLSSRVWDFIVLDRFRTTAKESGFWSGLAPVIGIDEGGGCRGCLDFTIDLLPSLSKHAPNLTAPWLLPLPHNRRSSFGGKLPVRVLISFGAEDSAGLGLSAASVIARAVLKKGGENCPLVTLVAPVPPDDSVRELLEMSGVKVVAKLPKLRERFSEYDLLITHFGLGAFEALYARLPVLLISPTAYHEKLGRNACFFSLGQGEKAIRRLGKLDLNNDLLEELAERSKAAALRFGLAEEQKEDLGFFINSLDLHAPRSCPVCGEKAAYSGGRVLARFPERSYRLCKRCGIIYMSRLNPPPVEYEKDYFFASYKKQYGKTYLEDFPNLKEAGKKRLAHIKALLDTKAAKPALLDIGCAYGAFLSAAAESGFSPAGIEPAEDAVRYVKDKLGLPVRRAFFPLSADSSQASAFYAVTLWYVIEHFTDCGKVLKETNRLLKKGGVLAFSTPSFSGISGRKSLKTFLENSPPDHFTVFSPKSCKKVFREYGFELREIVVTGHHPERFPLLGRFVSPAKKGLLYGMLFFMSRLFRLGDTFEVYAVKV